MNVQVAEQMMQQERGRRLGVPALANSGRRLSGMASEISLIRHGRGHLGAAAAAAVSAAAAAAAVCTS